MRIRFVKGTITKTTGGNHNMYSNGNIVTNAGGSINETAVNGIMYGEPEKAPVNMFNKKVIDMYWTYGETKLSDKSRFYVDMNLVVKTINYKEGENIEVYIKSEDGEPLTDDQNELILKGVVNKENIVVFENALKDYTLNLFGNEELESTTE
ncbi:hypothetical protein SAMN05444671_1222 [Flavobacterium sp. CF108]|uniref:hypothetical protein n=1 Tax=unclassified Flavobacterium TaxID=196869 RepID=UPI0008B8CB93|nr:MULTISPECIES: hypothetical protein [unclassified Flavobacterium]SEO85504.1 hypothetical protein SAMN04487978_3831 [Flavobacterium sp. fv08]SHG69827.1 hypothetical protein SAMN05444671_1222 [Flavobacterium sp. CF108]